MWIHRIRVYLEGLRGGLYGDGKANRWDLREDFDSCRYDAGILQLYCVGIPTVLSSLWKYFHLYENTFISMKILSSL